MPKTYIDENGYFRFNDSDELVHRWVAYKKIYKKGNYSMPFSSYIVHHKDGNKLNNAVSNLQIVTQDEHEEIHNIRKHCFIATTVYNSPFTREVVILKNWRDKVLNKNKFGRLIISTYYKLAPRIANFIQSKELLKKVIRIFLNIITRYILKKYYTSQ